MEINPQIFKAKVFHKRFFPKVNQFTYRVYYLALPLKTLGESALKKRLAINKFGYISFHEKDHATKVQEPLEPWAKAILAQYQFNDIVTDVSLISLPRILNYVFNPVSFWMCFDADKNIRAVICEVNNTFGETHSYFCAHEDKRAIQTDDILRANKLFHVSPFLQRSGHYEFKFNWQNPKLKIHIDYFDENNKKQLVTSLSGKMIPLTKQHLRKVFWTHPLVTFKTIFLIHWQAIKLISKGIKYVPKPKQHNERLSQTQKLTKL